MKSRRKKLKTITQRYLSYDYLGQPIRLPLLCIRFRGPNASLRTTALVDSGSSVTLIETEIAEALGCIPEGERSVTGAGGEFQNWMTTVDAEVLKGGRVVCELDGIEAYVPEDVGRIPYCILGRDSIFEHWDIQFRECQQRMVLRHPKKPE